MSFYNGNRWCRALPFDVGCTKPAPMGAQCHPGRQGDNLRRPEWGPKYALYMVPGIGNVRTPPAGQKSDPPVHPMSFYSGHRWYRARPFEVGCTKLPPMGAQCHPGRQGDNLRRPEWGPKHALYMVPGIDNVRTPPACQQSDPLGTP